jgi:brefeldin A-inhibited guanine nucleotide-exchange protein
LTQGGFRLPGEAQKIDRLLTAFAQCYWEDNAGDKQHCPFGDQDTIFTLSFAIILLNTDLHKAADVASTANKKRQKKKRMSKAEFMNNLRGVSKGCDIDREYLSSIFDSIEAQPIVFNRQDETETSESKVETDSDDLKKCIEGMSDNANSADALLRGLSTHEYRYISIQEHALSSSLQVDRLHAVHAVNSATLNIIREFFNKTWHQYHGLINSSLKIAHLDHKAMESCIDLLKFALFLTIVHDTPMERVAFLDQLGRFRKFNAYRTGTNHTSIKVEDQETFKNEGWYKCIAEISCDKSSIDHGNSQLNALKMLDDVVNGLGITIASDFVGKKILRDAVRQLENSEYLLNDPNRKFLRQGDLLKRSNKTGRFVEYRFFLFSDALVYAKKIVSFEGSSTPSKFRIHEELPLILMKVLDWFPPEMKKDTSQRAFQIYHPRKTFLVLCNTHDDRKSWVNDIRRAIDVELQHKVATAAARKAAATVPSVLPPPPVLQAPPQQKEKQQASHEKYNGSCASTSDSATIKTTNY